MFCTSFICFFCYGLLFTIPYAIKDNSTDASPNRVSVVVTDGTWTSNGWSAGAKLLQYDKLEMDSFGLSATGSFVLNGKGGDAPANQTVSVFAKLTDPIHQIRK